VKIETDKANENMVTMVKAVLKTLVMFVFPVMYGIYVVSNPDIQTDADGNRIDCYVFEDSDECQAIDFNLDETPVNATQRFVNLFTGAFVLQLCACVPYMFTFYTLHPLHFWGFMIGTFFCWCGG
jgi:hypothetical protein